MPDQANQPAPEETASENPPPLPPPRPPRPPADSCPPGRLPVSTGHSLIGMAAEARAGAAAGRPTTDTQNQRTPHQTPMPARVLGCQESFFSALLAAIIQHSGVRAGP